MSGTNSRKFQCREVLSLTILRRHNLLTLPQKLISGFLYAKILQKVAGFCSTISAKTLFVLYLAAVMKSEKAGISQCENFRIFSVIQILREINFGHSRSYKTAVLAIFGALNCSEFC